MHGKLLCPTADSAIPAHKSSISVTPSSMTPPASNGQPEVRSSKVDGVKISLSDITREKCAKLIYDGLVFVLISIPITLPISIILDVILSRP